MEKLGIFVLYEKTGVVDRYVEFLLKELLTVVDKLIIVSNGKVQDESLKKLYQYTEEVYQRENIGLDAGAYADIIVNKIGKEGLAKWDELVLCNDTFYGPFVSLKSIVEKMNTMDIDFWGIDKVDRNLFTYIISYLYVFKGKMLKNGDLFDYFFLNIYDQIEDIADAYSKFEVGLYAYLKKLGYKEGSFTNCDGIYSSKNPDICIINKGLPVWKKKFFQTNNYQEKIYAYLLIYIKKYYDYYDTDLICENVSRQYLIDYKEPEYEITNYEISEIKERYNSPEISCDDLISFMGKWKQICICGKGLFGKATYVLFKDRIQKFEGFIQSQDYIRDNNKYNECGIIVAMNQKNTMEVKRLIGNKDNIMFFWKD